MSDLSNTTDQVARLREITRQLRAPGGCDWDRAQDYQSMRPHLIEEVHEVIDAVNRGDFADLQEELGDLLFLICFYVQLAEEDDRFSMADVARDIGDKLIRRHPHVFGDVKVDGVQDILRNWEEIKSQEKPGSSAAESGGAGQAARPQVLRKTEAFLPALLRAAKIQERVSAVGFDWPTSEGVLEKIQEECAELAQAVHGRSPDEIEDEFGDLLFCVVNLARHTSVNPETALQRGTEKFVRRFNRLEALALERGWDLQEQQQSQEELDELWLQVKAEEVG